MGDIADAALRCIARWGVAKTTLEDVAREAGSSRATVYRTYPGGKEALFAALADRELRRLETSVVAALATAADLEDALVAAISTVARHLEGHAAFQFLLAHEPGLVLPHLAFHGADALLARVRAFGAPLLASHLGGDLDEAAVAAEWVARIVLSYTSCPAPGVRLTDDASVRTLVRAFVLPGFLIPA
jgi:AcrR family transcriptional regulator